MRFQSAAKLALWTLSVAVVVQSGTPAFSGEWQSDFVAAQAEARRENRLLVVHFHTTWCGPCQQMERNVLHDAALARELGKHFVAVKVNGDQHPDLVSRFGVQAYPTDVIVDPSGRVVSRTAGYQDRGAYIAQLQRTQEQFGPADSKVAKKEPAAEGPNYKPSLRRAKRSATVDSSAVLAGAELDKSRSEVVVGLDGYSPVALAVSRVWSKGSEKFSVEHKGIVYLLADADEQKLFAANPAKYAPRLLGCDAVALWESDEAVPGSTHFGAYFDGDLFLFATSENRAAFKKNPTQYTRLRSVLQIDAIEPSRIR